MTTPGPDYIFECPKCKGIIKRESIGSGNTIGIRQYSDGYQDLPMLPSFPNLTKCESCGFILFLDDLKPVDYYNKYYDDPNPKYDEIEYGKFLDIYDHLKTLKIYPEREKFIRHMIWWGFNDRIRENKEIFINENDKIIWKENCEKLIELLDFDDINEKIMISELHRNLGNFDICIELIESLPKDFDFFKKPFIEKCITKDRCVFEIDISE